MSDLILRGGLILADAASPAPVAADIAVEGGTIKAISADLPADILPGAEVLDVTGRLVVPGLINAHIHSPGNLMRGTLDGLPLEVFMLYEVPQQDDGGEEAGVLRLRTLLGAAEMLRLGITTVADDAFFVPLTTTGAIDAIAGAYDESGMRATLGLDQPVVVEYEKYPFLAEILSEGQKARMRALPRETPEGMLAHYDHLISRWHGAGGGRIGAALSCSAPQRATPDYLRALSALARRHDLPFFCHILETRTQRVLGDMKYGKSLVRHVHDEGVLDAHMQVIHAIWVDDDDIALLAASGATVAHNPVCNMRLGSGVMPFRALARAGVPICLGTDEAISDDSHNLWVAMKTAANIHALGDPDPATWPRAEEILSAVWDGGNRVLRRPAPLGRIAVGAAADFAVLDLDAPPYRPLHDIRRQLVLCETGASVVHTVVAGEVVMRDGRLTTIDEADLVRQLRRIEPGLRDAARALRDSAAELEGPYREMVRRAFATDVDMERRLGR
ncbi:amidohydrolase family protein [Oceaniglobus roseus]|uniref:amidohydrolase family protein n=1 Tax=Oceaniglobus roseus TaxID=1737570 RepID=UPI000C7EC081|nr:amidohydrolase family protein [Kandeliimicrobium roseum]